MTTNVNLNEQLKRYFGFDKFKSDQEAIIRSLLEGHNVFVLMPTGGGKSLCYQLPSLIMDGTAIVVSPLIALMKNQVDVINGISDQPGVAHYLNSSLNKAAIQQVMNDVQSGRTKLLYVAPESLNKEDNLPFFQSFKISFYAIDEAHCISEWGHDFRPDYRTLRSTINKIGNAPVIALTATATDKVRTDIKKSLGINDAVEFKSSFNRPNLYYEVRQKTKDIDRQIIKFVRQHPGKSGIIYCLSRKTVEELAAVLKANEIKAAPYHAGLDSATRSQTQDDFLMERIDVIVATIAFGMGIDKPDVRLVLHGDCPNSLEAYFQEAGRAGRDGKKAYAVLLYNGHDERKMDKRIVEEFPDKQFIRDVYEHLAYFYQIALGDGSGHTFLFDITKFCQTFHHFSIQTNSALKILQRAGYIYYDMEPDAMARVRFLLDRDDLYRLDDSSADEDAVVLALLRRYSGLFTDYSYIDENAVAYDSGLTRQQVYLILKSLSHRHIIHYIPQRKLPTITYTRDREAADRLVLSPEVYDQRREQFVHRIKVILAYATNDDVCRSRQLLRYFGETRSTDCGICDVCLGHASSDSVSDADSAAVCERILRLLSDGKRHAVSEFASSHGPHANVAFEAVAYLIGEEKICCEDGEVWIEK